MLPLDDLEEFARQLARLAHAGAAAAVWSIKTIGDAVMFVSTDPRRLIDAVLELVDVAGVNDLPRLRVGVPTASQSAALGTGLAAR